jgi:hypothetical protein
MSKNDINFWDQTPDLSGFSGAIPKEFKAKKPKKGIKQIGKKTDEWEQARKELKKVFEANGVMSCELHLDGCWNKNALGFAHIDKRRNLSPDELNSVVLACNPCHEKVERLPHLEMREVLTKIIDSRGW